MRYYKATKEAHDYFTGWTTVKDELVTEKERNTRFRYLKDTVFEPVEISRKRTFFSFGVRFEMKEDLL